MPNIVVPVFFVSCILVVADVNVYTSFGKLFGNRKHNQDCDEYLGIPYAKPPIGALRFEDPAAWDEAYPAEGRQATSFGEPCPQMGSGSEDCLFLNVWVPSRGEREGLPALVFIHGGGLISGAGSASILGPVPAALNLYDGCGFAARQGVLVVTLNYRLGPLGFAAFEEGGGGGASANFGMKDQRQALRWLREQLPAFGGDPARVTIFGESAGGMSVFYHVASPVSRGLFRAAISESGFPTAWPWALGRGATLAFAREVGCTDPGALKACLRGLPAEALIGNETAAANPFAFPTASPPWQPSVDGTDLPRYPFSMFKDRQTNAVPMLAGSNTDEANLFVWPFYESGMNESQFEDIFYRGLLVNYSPVKTLRSEEIAEVFSAYTVPGSNVADRRSLAAQMTTDVSFQCGTRVSGQEYNGDFWLYRFNHRSACQFWLKPLIPGVYHTSELQYVWRAQAKLGCIFTPEESALSDRIQTMWANFSKCLDPTCGTGAFPRYTSSSRKALVLQTPEDTFDEDYRGDKCSLWDRLVYSAYAGQSGAPSASEPVFL